ncbi:Anaphase-promoting complex subunit 4 [Glycine soja]|uniref:Anaphase-promoting complex subunit 4 n=1 Tax=Glycine soja TaxID=3848 RepID=A0A0B2Q0C1_GLYSO|nr:Anaphase-promoting complex subunit 4 [Glycine soja]
MVGLSFTTLGQRNLKFQQGSLPPQPRRGSRRWLDPVAFHRPGAFLHERLHHRGGQGVDGARSVTGGAGTLRGKEDSCDAMLQGLISSVMNSYDNITFVKAFIGKILRDLSLRETTKRVLEKVFRMSLKTVKELLEDYLSPVFRGDLNETKAIQRLNLHKASTNGKHLLWLVERMIELRVVDVAVREWSEQVVFTADLQRAFRDDAWRNIVPGLPAVILRCEREARRRLATGLDLLPQEEFLSLLGGASPLVHQFLVNTVGEVGVKRISNVLSDAGKELECIVLDHLQHVVEVIGFRIGELRGLSRWHAHYHDIGLDESLINNATEKADESMAMKSTIEYASSVIFEEAMMQ